jgi:DNA repair protein RecO (recombination protein O)
MQWSDEAVILGVRPHGETAAVVELFTRAHGRHLGLVHGGRSRRLRPVLQLGNHVDVTWKARLADNLGHFALELRKGYAALLMDEPAALAAMTSMAVLARLLPERDPHPELYAATLDILRAFDDAGLWPALFVRWELQLLGELGFGLDLSECAATGVDADLIYVSPRSGRAVSRDAGKPYCDRLLKLPAFLLDETAPASEGDILAGLALTGHFLERDMLEPHGLSMPQARERLIQILARPPKVVRSA